VSEKDPAIVSLRTWQKVLYNQDSGGGGSGYAEASATNVVMAAGVESGNGIVRITRKNP
jgi:hypothetical protein